MKLKLQAKLHRPSYVGMLLAQYTNAVVIPPGPHNADELQALLDWYVYRGFFKLFFTTEEAAERHWENWLKRKRKDGSQ